MLGVMTMSQLTVILPPELEQQIYQRFVTLAHEAVNEVAGNHKRYYTQAELMKLFRCSIDVIKDWVNGGLRYFNKGNSIMFDWEDVVMHIESIKK